MSIHTASLPPTAREVYKQSLSALPRVAPWRMFWIICWAYGMTALDATIVYVSLPYMQAEPSFVPSGQKIPDHLILWVSVLYNIGFSAFAIPASKAGDRFGIARVMNVGCVFFVICSIVAGCSRYITYSAWQYGGFYVLIGARFLQGIGAALIKSNTMTMSVIMVEPRHIPKAISLNTISNSFATGLGPIIGGLLTQYVSWEYIFFINIAFGAATLIPSLILLPKMPTLIESRFDWLGCFLVVTALVCLTLGLTYIPADQSNQILGWTLTSAGLAVFAGFVLWQLRFPFAMVPAKLLKNRQIVFSLLGNTCNMAVYAACIYQFTFALQVGRCLSPITSGLVQLSIPAGIVVAGMLCQALNKRVASLYTKASSAGVLTGLTVLFGYMINLPIGFVVGIMTLFMTVLMVYQVTNQQFTMQIADPDIKNVVSGSSTMCSYMGMPLGIALQALVMDQFISTHWAGQVPVDPTCQSVTFEVFTQIYYQGIFTVECILCSLNVLALVFGVLSGTAPVESRLKGYQTIMKCRKKVPEKVDPLVAEQAKAV